MALVDELNRVKFISEDFQTYRDEADAFFQANYPSAFNNVIATDLGNALMDQLAFAMQSLAFMVNRRASELFLETAKLNSSIVKLAQMLGYPIHPGSPGAANLTINFPDAPYSFPVPIPGTPNPFQFQGPGDTVYEYRQPVSAILAPGQTQITIPIKEGQTRRLAFTSDGSANQQFSITGIPTGQFLYEDNLVVTVDGVEWTRSDLLKFEATNIYSILFTDNPPKLRFGDGILGNIPPEGSQIVISYVFGKGLAGSIGQDQISASVSPLVIGGQSISMTFTNTVGDVGSDPEDIRHVQAFASSFFRTQNAAVIKSDYDTIAQLQSGVAIADAQIIRGIANDIILQGYFTNFNLASSLLLDAAAKIEAAGVSGISSLGVSGVGGLFVGGTGSLGVSGTQFLGWNGSAVTGTQFLGVSGTPLLFVGGESGLGVSGIAALGVSGQAAIFEEAVSGTGLITTSVSGIEEHLSEVLSDTSEGNKVQVIVLGVDSNNKYIAPPQAVLDSVQNALRPLADAVVTVYAVDGSSRIVTCDIDIGLGISLTAVATDVISRSLNALINTTSPFGLLVRRSVGDSLYKSQIQDAITAANLAGDLKYINVKIKTPVGLIDASGNLIVGLQQVIQNGNINVFIDKRFTS